MACLVIESLTLDVEQRDQRIVVRAMHDYQAISISRWPEWKQQQIES
jgi:hypothetical protein